MKVKEIEILVPWGHVAGKAWGDDTNKLVLMVHGASDNAGSFDRLMPYLPTHLYYVCIDLPGHGKSSHFPKNVPIHSTNMILCLKIVVDSFNRNKLIIIGHSYGGQMSCLFTQLYPEVVEKLIIIESVCFPPISIEHFKQFTTNYIKNTIDIIRKTSNGSPPTYSYEQALSVVMNGRSIGKLTKEAAESLIKRNLKKVGDDQYVMRKDLRNKSINCFFLSMEYVVNLFKCHHINCPVLFIFAKNSIPQKEYYKDILNEIKKVNKRCVIEEVEGNHDVHNNSPEVVSPVINRFLNKFNSNL